MKKLLRVTEVSEITGLAVSTIWQYAREDKFPKPYKIAKKATRWSAQEVDEWIELQFAA